MNIKLCSSRWGNLSLGSTSSLPNNILLLPKAEKKYATNANEDYRFLFQEMKGESYKIRFSIFGTGQKDTFTVTTDPMLSLHFGFLLSHHLYHPHLGRYTFHQHSYNILYLSHAASEFTMGPGERFISMDVIFGHDLLEKYTDLYPALEEFVKRSQRQIPGRFLATNSVASIEVLRWLDEIIDFGTDGIEDAYRLDLLVEILLEQCLCDIKPNSGKRGIKLNQSEVNRLYKVEDLLNDSEQGSTLKELADIVGLTPNKLDKGFKEIYGHSVLHHRKEQKMRLALRLVDDKRYNSKEVASILGYQDPQSFTRAFRKRFGYTPYRRNGNNAPQS